MNAVSVEMAKGVLQMLLPRAECDRKALSKIGCL